MLTSESEELAGLMKVCFDGSTNIPERVLDKLIGTMEERSEAISYG